MNIQKNQNLIDFDQEAKKAKTRALAIKEGAAWSVMYGAGESYLIPYALELQATNLQTGLISSLTSLFGPWAQIFSSRLMEKHSRKKIIVLSVVFQSSTWLLFIALGLYFLYFGYNNFLIPLFIAGYILYAVTGALAGPPWFSMMGDLVPEKIRGKYFSQRNKVGAIVTVASTVFAGLILQWSKSLNFLIPGFLLLFGIASIHRFLSAYYLSQHYVPELVLEKKYYFSFWQFLNKIPFQNFNRFAFYVCLINLTAYLAAPYLTVYLWRELKLSPFWFTLITVAPGFFSYFFLPVLGKIADKYGNRELLRIGSILIIPQSLLWVISDNPIFLIFIPQLIGGIGWAAFNLAASNFIFDSVSAQRRGLVVSYYNILNGTGMFFGALAGGLIIKNNQIFNINVFVFIFLISAFLRFLVYVLLLPIIKEIRIGHHPPRKNPLNYLREIRFESGSYLFDALPFKKYKNINLNLKNKIFRK